MKPFYEMLTILGVNTRGFAFILNCCIGGIVGHLAATGFIDLLGDIARAAVGVSNEKIKRLDWHATHGFLSGFVGALYGMWTVEGIQTLTGSVMKDIVIATCLGIAPVLIIKTIVASIEIKTKGWAKFLDKN